MAYWGWPSAQEDAAERAVRAGVTLVDAVAGLRQRGGPRCGSGRHRHRPGGGRHPGRRRRGPDDVVGETPNLAARLQALAEPGAVVVADTTPASPGRCRATRASASVACGGFPAPMALRRVAGEGPPRPRPSRGGRSTSGRSSGAGGAGAPARRARSAREAGAWPGGSAGRRRRGSGIAGGRGPARAARRRGRAERHFACSPLRETSALHPVLSRLERAAGLRRDEAAEQSLRKLAAALELRGGRRGRVASRDCSGIPAAQAGAPAPRRRTLRGAAADTCSAAAGPAAVLVFEDVYRADPTSLELLGD